MSGELPENTPETALDEPIRIYVASLADYVDGRLHGRWIDADQSADAIQVQVDEMLAMSPMPLAEEWAIHDYEGFGPVRLSEYESFETVARVAAGIRRHGEAFAAWVSNVGTDTDELERFENAFLGTWPSLVAYAENLAEEYGVDDQIQAMGSPLAGYVRLDIEGLARDIEIEQTVIEGAEGVHIFGA